MVNFPPVITIDGPAASGKGTLGRALAKKLGFYYLDSGLLFRALGLIVIEEKLSTQNFPEIKNLARKMEISIPASEDQFLLLVNGRQLGSELRNNKVAQVASKIAVCGEIRGVLTTLQRSLRISPGLVCDGRDLGSVVFKDAILKIFLDATLEARVERRHKELSVTGQVVEKSDIMKMLEKRDARDRGRKVAPLFLTPDSFVVDSSNKSPEAVFEVVWNLYIRFGIERLKSILEN